MIYRPAYIVNPVGLDAVIQNMQQYLVENLTEIKTVFGRAYNNRSADGIRKEIFSKERDYIDIFSLDFNESHIYFDVNDTITTVNQTNTGQYDLQATIKIVVFANLQKVYTSKQHRADEDLKREVMNTVNQNKGTKYATWQLNTILNNLDDIYSGYNLRDEFILNMQPFTLFALEYNVIYKDKDNLC